jgi:hypothetical protein
MKWKRLHVLGEGGIGIGILGPAIDQEEKVARAGLQRWQPAASEFSETYPIFQFKALADGRGTLVGSWPGWPAKT